MECRAFQTTDAHGVNKNPHSRMLDSTWGSTAERAAACFVVTPDTYVGSGSDPTSAARAKRAAALRAGGTPR